MKAITTLSTGGNGFTSTLFTANLESLMWIVSGANGAAGTPHLAFYWTNFANEAGRLDMPEPVGVNRHVWHGFVDCD